MYCIYKYADLKESNPKKQRSSVDIKQDNTVMLEVGSSDSFILYTFFLLRERKIVSVRVAQKYRVLLIIRK